MSSNINHLYVNVFSTVTKSHESGNIWLLASLPIAANLSPKKPFQETPINLYILPYLVMKPFLTVSTHIYILLKYVLPSLVKVLSLTLLYLLLLIISFIQSSNLLKSALVSSWKFFIMHFFSIHTLSWTQSPLNLFLPCLKCQSFLKLCYLFLSS